MEWILRLKTSLSDRDIYFLVLLFSFLWYWIIFEDFRKKVKTAVLHISYEVFHDDGGRTLLLFILGVVQAFIFYYGMVWFGFDPNDMEAGNMVISIFLFTLPAILFGLFACFLITQASSIVFILHFKRIWEQEVIFAKHIVSKVEVYRRSKRKELTTELTIKAKKELRQASRKQPYEKKEYSIRKREERKYVDERTENEIKMMPKSLITAFFDTGFQKMLSKSMIKRFGMTSIDRATLNSFREVKRRLLGDELLVAIELWQESVTIALGPGDPIAAPSEDEIRSFIKNHLKKEILNEFIEKGKRIAEYSKKRQANKTDY